MTIEEMAADARSKKEKFMRARAARASFETLKELANEYMDACATWHKERFPGKKFKRQSVGYLIRAL
jgi:hypothetical protein